MRNGLNAAQALAATGINIDWVEHQLGMVDINRTPILAANRFFAATWVRGTAAITTPWAIYATPKIMERIQAGEDPLTMGRLLVHELAHVEQFKRLGSLRFLTQYGFDYLRGRWKRMGHWQAYSNIRLEVEAREFAQRVPVGGIQ